MVTDILLRLSFFLLQGGIVGSLSGICRFYNISGILEFSVIYCLHPYPIFNFFFLCVKLQVLDINNSLYEIDELYDNLYAAFLICYDSLVILYQYLF